MLYLKSLQLTANTALGTGAGESVVGASNTAIGQYALQAATTTNDNTAVGASALTANTGGAGTTGIGFWGFIGKHHRCF